MFLKIIKSAHSRDNHFSELHWRIVTKSNAQLSQGYFALFQFALLFHFISFFWARIWVYLMEHLTEIAKRAFIEHAELRLSVWSIVSVRFFSLLLLFASLIFWCKIIFMQKCRNQARACCERVRNQWIKFLLMNTYFLCFFLNTQYQRVHTSHHQATTRRRIETRNVPWYNIPKMTNNLLEWLKEFADRFDTESNKSNWMREK